MSLKVNLLNYLEDKKQMTLDQLYLICKSENKKYSNGERRMREIMADNSNVKAETNSKGAIIAYKWSVELNPAPVKEINAKVEKWLDQWKEPVVEAKNNQLQLL